MSADLALATRDLRRSFGPVTAVDGIDLEVATGEVTAFLGPNGAGKTTTIRLLVGLLTPDSGQVEVLGRALAEHRSAVLARIGALVEMPAHYSNLTGRENLRLTALLRGAPKSAIDRVLAQVRLERDAGRPVGQYSLGMKQRLGLARALLGDPELLILDEPTNGLDPAGIREIRLLITELPSRHGVTVFLSSHRLDEVLQIAGRLAVIRRGRLVFQGRTADFGGEREGVILETGSPTATAELAKGLGLSARVEEDGSVKVSDLGREAVADLIRRLAAAGIDLYRVEPRAAELERTFLELMDIASKDEPS